MMSDWNYLRTRVLYFFDPISETNSSCLKVIIKSEKCKQKPFILEKNV